MSAQPIGIFGGTFDPIHFGHLRMAEELREQLGLAQVRFIPSARPPHRGYVPTDATARAEMVRLAIAGNTGFALDTRELARSGPSYTVDTLLELRHELGAGTPLCLLLGSDAFFGLPSWHRWQELTELAHLVVAGRPGTQLQEALLPEALRRLWQEKRTDQPHDLKTAAAGRILWQTVTALDISSSELRAALQQGLSTRYLLPETVGTYIASHHLYAPEASKEHHGT